MLRDNLDLLPLRQVVIAAPGAAPVFARQALLDQISRPYLYHIIRYGSGAQIMAANEHALAHARALLLQAYGSSIAFGIPAVHSYVDCEEEVLMVPVVFLRIDSPRAHAPELQRRLAARRAVMKETDLQRQRVVLRAEMEMSRALGLAGEVGELTDGAAHVLSWLLRYERAASDAAAKIAGSRAPGADQGRPWREQSDATPIRSFTACRSSLRRGAGTGSSSGVLPSSSSS
jgi:hypothetical protein